MQKDKYFLGNFSLEYSAYLTNQLKNNNLPEIAFFGRSNVGKSSLINTLCRQNKLAKTSKTPGRTASINFFVNQKKNFFLADLPGYGYAATNRNDKAGWEKLISSYLEYTNNIKMAFILIDSRRGIMDSDREVIDIISRHEIDFQIIFTKADKIPGKTLEKLYDGIKQELQDYDTALDFFATSSTKKNGIVSLRKYISKVLDGNN